MADDQNYVRRGKGQKEKVGPTGIYPASAGQAPEDAEVIGQEELGHRVPGREALVPLNDIENPENNDK